MLSLWGMYQYDNTILDNMELPPGMETTVMINCLMEKAGDLWPYYQNPNFMRLYSNNWFHRKLYNFTLMYNALKIEYNPLHNYDRVEDSVTTPDITRIETPDITKIHKGDSTGTSSALAGETLDNHNTRTTSDVKNATTSSDDTITKAVSAFDVSTYSPREQTTTKASGSNHEDDTGSQTDIGGHTLDSHSSGSASSSDNATDTEQGTRTHTEQGTTTLHSTVKGNVGVTTSQQMLQSELDLRIYDLYETIAEMWIDAFIIMVY